MRIFLTLFLTALVFAGYLTLALNTGTPTAQYLVSGVPEVVVLPPNEPIVKEMDLTGLAVPIRVVIHPSLEDLTKAYGVWYMLENPTPVWGWYTYREGVCEIHVTELKGVRNDPRMQTWGHELAHCMYGRYHQ